MRRARPSPNKPALATAKFIPIFLAALVAYSTYVVTGPLTIDYLLNSSNTEYTVNYGSGIAIPIVFWLLLVPVGATWLRLLIGVWKKPGYIAQGDPDHQLEHDLAPGLDAFYEKDVFVCDSKGFPKWCDRCRQWKPDRAHHNQDVGRCTLKMDHFCPWVGGVVGERAFKFFLQFLFYSFVLCGFAVAVFAYYVAERARRGMGQDPQWLIVLGLAGFFCIFTFGMLVNSLWLVSQNLTTIEQLDFGNGTIFLAVFLPPELQGQDLNRAPDRPKPAFLPSRSTSPSHDGDRPLSSDLDDLDHSHYSSGQRRPRPLRRSSIADQIWKGSITYPTHLPVDRPPLPAPELRTFAILETLPGMHIWDLGSRWANLQTVLGSTIPQWLLPVKHSPCCDHSSTRSQYALGPDFEELLIEVGLLPRPDSFPSSSRRAEPGGGAGDASGRQRKRQRRRRLDPGWENGERPDGWISEREARRNRNQWRRHHEFHGQRHQRDELPRWRNDER